MKKKMKITFHLIKYYSQWNFVSITVSSTPRNYVNMRWAFYLFLYSNSTDYIFERSVNEMFPNAQNR